MKIDNFLIKLSWSIELILSAALILFCHYFIFTNLDNTDKIILIAMYIIILLANSCKIPIATALIFAQKFFYKLLFLFTLLLLALVSFETYLQAFELYIVNYNFIDEYNQNYNLIFLFLSFVFALVGSIFALAGLYLRKKDEDKKIMQYYKEF